MAYDEGLAERVREALRDQPVTEKKMFGGLAFMIGGNMACGVMGDDLMVRMDPDQDAQALAAQGARPFDMGGRTMKGWLLVDTSGHEDDRSLAEWVHRGVEFAGSLPPK